jgi:prolyl-tRNA synthetase
MSPRSVLTSQSTDFPQWYQEVLAKAELADNGPVRGTMVIRPYGYSIWERMQAEIDARIKAAGVPNAYFPLFIPESYLHREAAHVEGFSPELAVVTHGGGKKLEEPVVVRPTSETIINAYFAKWIQSHRDLPMLINQWANVVRWELRPRLFLRTTEFLWQEGHTAHATEHEARAFALQILHDVYESVMVDVLGVPVLVGAKTERERFSGAVTTWTCEAMMRDGKALQMGTSHELGQNFARVFGTTFLDESGQEVHVWQTSWGVSTRLMGALVMAHGDDAGLRVPPRIAPIQVVVLLVREDEAARQAATALAARLTGAGLRTHLDDRTDKGFGMRVVDWELKGVPVRVEVGPRELEEHNVVLVRRDTRAKQTVALHGIEAAVAGTLDDVQRALAEEAASRRVAGTVDAATVDEAEEAARTGFATVPWRAVGAEGEARLNRAGVSVRLLTRRDGSLPERDELELAARPHDGAAPGGEAELVAVVARAY